MSKAIEDVTGDGVYARVGGRSGVDGVSKRPCAGFESEICASLSTGLAQSGNL